MNTQILISLSEDEFKQFLKDAIREALSEQQGMQQESLPQILNVQQAAGFLNLKPATLYEKTSRKQIPHFKKGNKLYFHLSELEEWISAGKVTTDAEMQGKAITYTLTHRKKAS